jgi:hypothetical protein
MYFYLVDGEKRFDHNQPDTFYQCPISLQEFLVNTVKVLDHPTVETMNGKSLNGIISNFNRFVQ